jgi:hypothetical protein
MTARKTRPTSAAEISTGASSRDIEAATGISRAAQWRAMQIASIPRDQFAAIVESDNPPSVTKLLDMAQRRAASKRKPTVCPHCGGAL